MILPCKGCGETPKPKKLADDPLNWVLECCNNRVPHPWHHVCIEMWNLTMKGQGSENE